MSNNGIQISRYPVHLGRGATAGSEPEFTGELAWYASYAARHESDGVEGRLVSMHTFSASWPMWEMHPLGHEVVLCTAGELTLIQKSDDGAEQQIVLTPGHYAINPPGVWHTADIAEGGSASAVFITAGQGTEHKPR